MTTPDVTPIAACCGDLKPANAGREPTNACIVCPLSPTYWRDRPDAKARRSWEHPAFVGSE